MFKIGSRVYDEFNIDCTGEIVDMIQDKAYVKSILDDSVYFVDTVRLWEVGTGPVTETASLYDNNDDEELEQYYLYLQSQGAL